MIYKNIINFFFFQNYKAFVKAAKAKLSGPPEIAIKHDFFLILFKLFLNSE